MNIDNLENALVAQKDLLVKTLNDATPIMGDKTIVSITGLTNLIIALRYIVPVWNASNYGYKGREIVERIKDALWEHELSLHHNATAQKTIIHGLKNECNWLLREFKTFSDIEPQPV